MAHHWRTICCPVDFSDPSRGALLEATELVARGTGRLVVLHVYKGPTLDDAAVIAPPELHEQLLREAQHKLEAWVAEAEHGLKGRVAGEMISGDPASRIVEFAKNHRVDLLVMGTHGRSGLSRLLLGSVTERVTREAPCSVLVVRPSELLSIEPD